MTALDPYPTDLAALDDQPFKPASLEPMVEVPLIAAINRVATALEQIALAILDNGSRPAQNGSQSLAALPPVQTVANTPPCPLHGTATVRSSTQGSGGFYCAAKAQPGQPSNPKGYCTWHS